MVQVETYVYKTLFDTHKHAYFYIEGEESDSTPHPHRPSK